MKIVDTKGQLCPAPLIAAKKALKEIVVGESFVILTDNKTSFDNLSRFLKDNNCVFLAEESSGVWTMTVTKITGTISESKAEDYCSSSIPLFHKGDYIVVLASDKMGEGDEVLGHLLMSNFIKALKDIDKLPQKILCYNNGVKLAADNSPVVEHLRDMEKMGVELLLCATCVNHYKLEKSVSTGTLSNMFAIAEIMASAVKIIRP